MIDGDLSEFLSSKLEFQVYHFFFFYLQLELEKSSALLVQTYKPLVRLQKSNGCCLLRCLPPVQSTEQVITLPGEEKLLEIN